MGVPHGVPGNQHPRQFHRRAVLEILCAIPLRERAVGQRRRLRTDAAIKEKREGFGRLQSGILQDTAARAQNCADRREKKRDETKVVRRDAADVAESRRTS